MVDRTDGCLNPSMLKDTDEISYFNWWEYLDKACEDWRAKTVVNIWIDWIGYSLVDGLSAVFQYIGFP